MAQKSILGDGLLHFHNGIVDYFYGIHLISDTYTRYFWYCSPIWHQFNRHYDSCKLYDWFRFQMDFANFYTAVVNGINSLQTS